MVNTPEGDDEYDVGPAIPEQFRKTANEVEDEVGPSIPDHFRDKRNEATEADDESAEKEHVEAVDLGPSIPESLKKRNVERDQNNEEDTESVTKKQKLDEDVVEDENVFKIPGIPKPEKMLKFEETYLRAIPRATQYEKSFMHRDTLSHVISTM